MAALPPALVVDAPAALPGHVCSQDGSGFDPSCDLPPAPRPPTLPELTHPDIAATIETTVGALVAGGGGGTAHVAVERLSFEVPMGARRWFVGASYEVAGGDATAGPNVVGGNLEVGGRTLWATRTGLAFGGGADMLLPTASFQGDCLAAGAAGPSATVACSAAMLRPWDVSMFVPGAFGLRPFVDVRALDGPLVVQLRQGLDLTVGTAALGDRRLWATMGLYVGYRATPHIALGLEAFETYAIDVPNVRDGGRSAIVASPDVRLSLPWVQPALSVFTNVGGTLYGGQQSVWGARLAFTFVYDRSTRDAPRPSRPGG